MTPGLSAEARRSIKGRGFTVREYVEHISGTTRWYGDTCGCADDRCGGFHHDETDPCGCLPALLDELARDRTACELWRRHFAGEHVHRGAVCWARWFGGAHAVRITGEGINVARPRPNPGYPGTHDLPERQGIEAGHWWMAWTATTPGENGAGPWWPITRDRT